MVHTAPWFPSDELLTQLYSERTLSLATLTNYLINPARGLPSGSRRAGGPVRFLELVGPPGCGKSMLLRRIYLHLLEQPRPSTTFFPLFLDLTTAPFDEADLVPLLDQWLLGQAERLPLNGRCIDRVAPSFDERFRRFLDRVCNDCGASHGVAVLLVDGIEEVNTSAREAVINRVLWPLLNARQTPSSSQSCTRAVFTRRTDVGDIGYRHELKRAKLSYSGWVEFVDVQDQLGRLLDVLAGLETIPFDAYLVDHVRALLQLPQPLTPELAMRAVTAARESRAGVLEQVSYYPMDNGMANAMLLGQVLMTDTLQVQAHHVETCREGLITRTTLPRGEPPGPLLQQLDVLWSILVESSDPARPPAAPTNWHLEQVQKGLRARNITDDPEVWLQTLSRIGLVIQDVPGLWDIHPTILTLQQYKARLSA